MDSDLRSIGEMARASGLTVSALRFYDGAGLLVPATVDPRTGYRWYAADQVTPARLVASLRRVGMPLAGIGLVLRCWPEPVAVRRLLDAHLRRLADGLADARRELSTVYAQLTEEEQRMGFQPDRLTLAGPDLAAALDAVRFAVGRDPETPMLGAVLFEPDGDRLRLVATDRYRLAVAQTPAHVDGPGTSEGVACAGTPARSLVPVGLVDAARALLTAGHDANGTVTLDLHPDRVSLRVGTSEVAGAPLEHDFPDYRRALRRTAAGDAGPRVTVDVAALRAALAGTDAPTVVRKQDGVVCAVAALRVDGGGLRVLGRDELAAGERPQVGVDREFLLDALTAGGRGQLVLELDGPIRPLAIRLPGDEETFSVLMPIRP